MSRLIAIDTETTLIRERVYAADGATCISPDEVPDLVCASVCIDGARPQVLWGDALCSFLGKLQYYKEDHLVFHNVAFDYFVLIKAMPGLKTLIDNAIEEGRVHDTMLLEILLNIARGRPRRDGKPVTVSDRLDALEASYGVASLRDKTAEETAAIRTGFGAYLGRQQELPQKFLDYAATDALSTYLVYKSQLARAALYNDQAPPGSWEKYGVLSESIQVKGAIALAWLARSGIHVDVAEASRRDAELLAEQEYLQAALILYGYATRSPKAKKFSVKQKHLRGVLQAYAAAHNITPEYSDSGLVSLAYDFWAKEIPAHPPNTPVHVCATEAQQLSVWMRYCRCQRLRSRYTSVYAAAPTHYPRYYVLGARTGRTSASCPCIQQVPKRRDALRNLFIAPEGCVLIEADFSAAELVCLAQIQTDMFGFSSLADAINAGQDPHIATARRLRPDFDALDDAERKRLRQVAKAVNFGLGGGLGAARFAKYLTSQFNLPTTEAEARELRTAALESDPALCRYLKDDLTPQNAIALAAKNLCLTQDELLADLNAVRDWAGPSGGTQWLQALRRLRDWSRAPQEVKYRPRTTPPGFDPRRDLFKSPVSTRTGRVRGLASYTEKRNTPFQGLTADAIKLALWGLYKVALEYDIVPSTTTHDSVLVHVPKEKVQNAASLLHNIFTSALGSLTPNVKAGAEVTVLGRSWAGD